MVIDKNKMYNVQNRSASMVGYAIEERHITREFQPYETKTLPFWELEALSFQSGGRRLISDFLLIREAEVTESLNIPTQPEYYMNEKQIKDLLMTGSLDAFLDCLDFAPDGVIEIIKKMAVDLPLNDVSKRKALLDKTGFDVGKAIETLAPDEEEAPAAEAPKRRVQPASKTPGRRTAPNYKVVSQ